jgi:hypothetical protein
MLLCCERPQATRGRLLAIGSEADGAFLAGYVATQVLFFFFFELYLVCSHGSVLQGYGDIFTFMATHLFDKLPIGITRKDREQCKRVTYGTLYGIGPHSLGLEMKVFFQSQATASSDFISQL